MKIQRVRVSRIYSVFDGDTFRCDVDTWPKLFGYHLPVRLRGIDCRERGNKDPEHLAQALKARDFTRAALLNGSDIILVNVERGKYFRIVADCFIDGHDLAAALLANGLAVRKVY